MNKISIEFDNTTVNLSYHIHGATIDDVAAAMNILLKKLDRECNDKLIDAMMIDLLKRERE